MRGPKTPQHSVKNLGAPGPQHFASSQNSSTLCHQPSVSLSSTLCDLWGAQQFASSWGSTLCEHRGLLTKTRRDGVHKNRALAALMEVSKYIWSSARKSHIPSLGRCQNQPGVFGSALGIPIRAQGLWPENAKFSSTESGAARFEHRFEGL